MRRLHPEKVLLSTVGTLLVIEWPLLILGWITENRLLRVVSFAVYGLILVLAFLPLAGFAVILAVEKLRR